MLESSKKIGKYEDCLLPKVEQFLVGLGYVVSTHVRLNIAWSNIISDIDVIAKKEHETIIVEVKSDHDNFYKAFKQLNKLEGFADKFYVATNRSIDNSKIAKWPDDSIGLIAIGDNNTRIEKPAKRVNSLTQDGTVSQLRKKCLVRLAGLCGIPNYLSKEEIEKRLLKEIHSSELKGITTKIALCDGDCINNCILIPNMIASTVNFKGYQPKAQRTQ
jgi:hypothetical protein